MKKSFFVKAIWDDESKVYISQSDIRGLVIEATSIEEFEAVMNDVAAELILANHRTVPQLSDMALKDLIPTILWQRPDDNATRV